MKLDIEIVSRMPFNVAPNCEKYIGVSKKLKNLDIQNKENKFLEKKENKKINKKTYKKKRYYKKTK